MLELFLRSPQGLARSRSSSVGPYLDDFAVALGALGYSRKVGARYIAYAVHLGQWATANDVPLETLDDEGLTAFLRHLPRCRCPGQHAGRHEVAPSSTKAFVQHLRTAGVIPMPVGQAATPERVSEFCEWMRLQRGLMDTTVRQYRRIAITLVERLGDDPAAHEPRALRAAAVREVTGSHGTSTARFAAKVARAFLRYLAVKGRCRPGLDAAILPVASPSLASLPRYVSTEARGLIGCPQGPISPRELSLRTLSALDSPAFPSYPCATRCALCLPPGAVLVSLGCALRAALVARDVAPLAMLAAQRTRLDGLHLHMAWERFDEPALRARIETFAGAGFAPRLHAIGNAAVAQAARTLAAVRTPHATIEHVLLARPEEIALLAACGVIVSTQPGFIPTHGPAMRALGLDVGLRPVPLASLLRGGVSIAISSDHPCGPLDPLHNLRHAVSRRLPDGERLTAAEAITQREALHAATAGGAAAVGFAGAGTLALGAAADLVVCSGDPFAEDGRVARTWVEGRRA